MPHCLLTDLIPVERVLMRWYEPWMSLVLLGSVVVFALIKRQYPGFLQLAQWNVSNYRIARQFYEEGEYRNRQEWLIMYPVSISAIALFGYVILSEYELLSGFDGAHAYLHLVALLALVYLLKILAADLVMALASPILAVRTYIGNTLMAMHTLALPLLCISMVAALTAGWFVRPVLWAGLILFCAAWLVRIARGVRAALDERISLNYIILYLCTLEFLPAAVLVKAWLLLHAAA